MGFGLQVLRPVILLTQEPATLGPVVWQGAGDKKKKRVRGIFQVGPEFIQSVWAKGQFSCDLM